MLWQIIFSVVVIALLIAGCIYVDFFLPPLTEEDLEQIDKDSRDFQL